MLGRVGACRSRIWRSKVLSENSEKSRFDDGRAKPLRGDHGGEGGEKGRKKGHAEVRDLGPAISGRSPRVDPYKASATLASGNPA